MSRSEFDFIERVRRQVAKRHDATRRHTSLVHGIGDDAAVVRGRGAACDTVVTADLLVEDVDFRRAYAPPRLLGHKALAVSLSDVAAMGARPRFALLSAGLPRDVWESDGLDDFYAGYLALAEHFGVTLVGGDVSRTPERIVFDSVVLGEVARGRAVMRAGARPGDRIFVTGALGGASAGLRLLEAGARLKTQSTRGARTRTTHATAATRRAVSPAAARERRLLRHLRPDPRVEWGRRLGEARLASAMIDLSDGLSSDLAHLCRESGVGAAVEASLLPLDPHVRRAGTDADPLALALDGGEDFELLFTVPPRRAARLPAELGGVTVTEIGEITDDKHGLRLRQDGRTRPLRPTGFTHFGNNDER
ncbi:MAG TPA: thiamine-phosphate kinase [Pyrinomonadaceae bacterium]|nr:thiamine-phosphate kinase [Pyrinomonadaceae bacterium]